MKKLLIILLMSVLLVGCGSADTTDNAQGTEAQQTQEQQTQEEQKQEESHTHNYVEEITTEATCEADGLKTLTCECGDSYTEVITATGHIYENYVSNNDATYLADGTETATCVCGLTDTRTAEGSKLEYTFTDCEAVMYAKSSVNVRDLPSTDGERVGGLSARQEVHVTGQCNETGWYKIDYNGGVGYVSNSYIVAEKPAEPEPQPEQPSQPDTPSECPYEVGVWYDMGWYFFKVCASKDEIVLGSNHEYADIIRSRYPDAFRVASDAGYTKWGYWVYEWLSTPLQGETVIPWAIQ